MPENWAVRDDVASRSREGVLWVRLARADDGNALRWPMMMELARLAALAGADPEVRALVLTGEGASFCEGEAHSDMGSWPDAFRHRAPAGAHGPPPVVQQHMLRAWRAVPKPTLALLNGRTLGLGLDLACVCDFRVAATDAVLGDPRLLQGAHGATGISYLLPRLIGLSRATWMLLGGFEVDAIEALRIGLVHQLSEDVAAHGVHLAGRLAAMPTRSFAVKKEMVLAQLDLTFEAAMMHCLAVRQTNVIEDNAEGLAAWRDRRPPRFTGR